MMMWILPLLALSAAIIAIFEKSFKDGVFRLTKVGTLAGGVAVLVACFSIYQNYQKQVASIEIRVRHENIVTDLKDAEDQRDALQENLNVAKQNILTGTIEITNAVAEAKKLNALLNEAKIQISGLEVSLGNTNRQLNEVLERLKEAQKENFKLIDEVFQIGSRVSQLGSAVIGSPTSEHFLDLQGISTGILKIASLNCNYYLFSGASRSDVFTSLGWKEMAQNVTQTFEGLSMIKLIFTNETDVDACEASYSVVNTGS